MFKFCAAGGGGRWLSRLASETSFVVLALERLDVGEDVIAGGLDVVSEIAAY
ncbi:hypothetical protein ACL9RL_18160 [Plantibacter sp. Mn2098]|uniref:hypothetical protein n=1 Tax=Plantibacter sp. Mn2098 TaxID=3395266 RepID=UPI003BEE6D3F